MTLKKWVNDPIILGTDPICLRVMETPGKCLASCSITPLMTSLALLRARGRRL